MDTILKTEEEILIPLDHVNAYIDRLGNIEFLSDQKFTDSDKYSASFLLSSHIMMLKGFEPTII